MPTRKTKMTCKFVSKMQDFDWDLPAEDFACAEPIALLIGGQDNDLRYLDEVEIVSPDLNCQKTLRVAMSVSFFRLGSYAMTS